MTLYLVHTHEGRNLRMEEETCVKVEVIAGRVKMTALEMYVQYRSIKGTEML